MAIVYIAKVVLSDRLFLPKIIKSSNFLILLLLMGKKQFGRYKIIETSMKDDDDFYTLSFDSGLYPCRMDFFKAPENISLSLIGLPNYFFQILLFESKADFYISSCSYGYV